jgi:hypothetical protein
LTPGKTHVLLSFMNDAANMAEQHSLVLAELTELGLTLARDLHARAMAAETADDARDLGLAFHRISRSIRQTLALEAKLERDRQRQDREDRAEATRAARDRVYHRRTQVHAAVERAIWTEAEDYEAERLLADLDLHLDEAGDTIVDAPIEALIAQIQADLGLAAAAVQSSPTGGGGLRNAVEGVSASDAHLGYPCREAEHGLGPSTGQDGRLHLERRSP